MIWTLYQINCVEPFHYYVGITTQPRNRQQSHREGGGAKFTQKHGVKDWIVLGSFGVEAEAKAAEKNRVLELRQRKNAKVAGAGWTQTM